MAQIGREGDEVPGDLAALGAALFERSSCKGMAKIVDAGWRARPGAIFARRRRQRKV